MTLELVLTNQVNKLAELYLSVLKLLGNHLMTEVILSPLVYRRAAGVRCCP